MRDAGGDHGTTAAHGVGEGPAHRLCGILGGEEVDVGELEMLQQFVQFQVAVHEAHMIPQTQLIHFVQEHLAVLLAFLPDDFGMGAAQHQVEHIGHLLFDGHQCVQRGLDALVAAEQSEGGEHTTALQSVLLLHPLPVTPFHHVRSVGDHHDLVGGDGVFLAQDPRRALGEHDDVRSAFGQCADRLLAFGRRRRQHRVEGDGDRLGHRVHEPQEIASLPALVQAELVLDPDAIDARIPFHFMGKAQMIVGIRCVQDVRHFARIVTGNGGVLQCADGVAVGPRERAVQGRDEILCVRGDAANTRRIRGEDKYAVRFQVGHRAFLFNCASKADMFTEATATRSSAAP